MFWLAFGAFLLVLVCFLVFTAFFESGFLGFSSFCAVFFGVLLLEGSLLFCF